jgi:hypothetical protein
MNRYEKVMLAISIINLVVSIAAVVITILVV